ncbi:MAG: hypothetical protein JWM05_1033 [Acidimicrobiales bacterium]|nr:hypothetical protein [Acidimicrobiales bacterium]
MTTSSPAHTAAAPVAAPPTTLRGWARAFRCRPTPKLIVAELAVALGARLVVAGWGWIDVLALGVVLALEPFAEWAIHVVILHWRPRHLLGRELDLVTAEKHRRHHAAPRDLDILFVPMRVLVFWLPLLAATAVLVLPTGIGLTVVTSALAILLAYEWTHFLIHSPYQPRHRAYRHIWRAHRLHHYRNEHYWFGVTSTLGDQVLGTFPDKRDVELSPTVRTLGIDGGV